MLRIKKSCLADLTGYVKLKIASTIFLQTLFIFQVYCSVVVFFFFFSLERKRIDKL